MGWQMSTEEAAKKAYEAVPKLKPGEYSGVLISPWEWCPIGPDVVIFFGNASQILVIVTAYIYDKGGTLSFSANGIGTCAGAIIVPIKENRPNIVLPGNPKVLFLPSDTDLLCGIPGSLLESMLKGCSSFTREEVAGILFSGSR